jgi:ferredoxin
MPARFHIRTEPAGPRVLPVGKLGIVDWREDCAGCKACVKRGCVYSLFRDEADRLRNENGYLDYVYRCRGCLSCVQNCTKGLLTRVLNPEYLRLGNDAFTPEAVLSTWFQAETGAIPVTGSGYGGPFSGDGFDSMWTDMSEIVRPTRDGIHGREYISTSVDIGRKLDHLEFVEGKLSVTPPPLLETPLPVMFDVLPAHWHRGSVAAAVLKAAARIGLFAITRDQDPDEAIPCEPGFVVPLLGEADASLPTQVPAGAPMVMLDDGEGFMTARDALKRRHPGQIVGVRVPAKPGVAARVCSLAHQGAEVIGLRFDAQGREQAARQPRHMRDVIREVHDALTRDGTRDQITLLSFGGIVEAEHVAKAIICGVDLVAIDLPLVVALECRLCGECARGGDCPIALHQIDSDYAVQRIVNLMGAWHGQLIELLGAMGLREVRRLRGETGRAMFFEDLERNVFGRLFGRRAKDSEVDS